MKHGLVMLVVIMILEDTATFQVLFIVFLFCAWNTTTEGKNSGVHLLKVKSAKCLSLLPVVLILLFGLGLGLVSSGLVVLVLVFVLRIWSCLHHCHGVIKNREKNSPF